LTIRSPTPPGRPDGVRIRIVEGGFPHSEILGSKLVRSSPRLIAAYHVLHRLSAPRHPPNALKTLDHSHDRCPPPGSENPGDRRLIRKTIGSNLSARALACRTHPVKDAVTSSLVAETRKFGYRACSLFTISNIRAPPRDRLRTNCSKTSGQRTRAPSSWWSQTGSNRRPRACKARALPTELWPHLGGPFAGMRTVAT
jgi:hypothetical protein